MSERCRGNQSFLFGGTISELRESFPGLIEVSTASKFNDARHKRDVYVLDKGKFLMVNIRGQCPDLQEGICILKERCISNIEETTTPEI